VVLGALFSQILFFLNPHLPFTPATTARAMTAYGLSGGAVSLGLTLAASRFRARRALRLLPWGLTLAFTLAAILSWSLPAQFGFFLPPGINVRLLKAAVWLSLSALVGFYTALLHTLSRRPYGLRSRWAFVLLALGSVYAMAERRGAFAAAVEPSLRPALVEWSGRPGLLVVGLDAASLDAILPLAEQGALPFFSRLLETGSCGHLISLDPSRRGPLWTTLATGKLPYKHGVVGSTLYPASALGKRAELDLVPAFEPFRSWAKLGVRGRPTDGRARRVLALWESLAHLGLPVGVVGWPLASPLPRNLRFAVSDRYFADPGDADEAWPEDLAARGELFRVAPVEVAAALPDEGALAGRQEVAAALAADLWRVSLAAYLLEQEDEPAAILTVLPGLSLVAARYWGGYNAAQFEGIQRSPYREAAALVQAYYARLDTALAELWARQQGPGLLAVVSAHGTAAASGWRRIGAEISSRRSLAGHFSPAPDGILLLYGEGIRPGQRLADARLVDVVPTLLYGLGLPVARDLDGQVLLQAFEASYLARHPLTFVPTYEALRPRSSSASP
jgi:predicted AlkP superfamily phosphohydrolase/phosphomutase